MRDIYFLHDINIDRNMVGPYKIFIHLGCKDMSILDINTLS
jgi:hypothetical protein